MDKDDKGNDIPFEDDDGKPSGCYYYMGENLFSDKLYKNCKKPDGTANIKSLRFSDGSFDRVINNECKSKWVSYNINKNNNNQVINLLNYVVKI